LVQPRRPGHFALCRPHCRVPTKELSVGENIAGLASLDTFLAKIRQYLAA